MGRESQVPVAQASRWPRRRYEVNAAAPSRCQQTRSLPGSSPEAGPAFCFSSEACNANSTSRPSTF